MNKTSAIWTVVCFTFTVVFAVMVYKAHAQSIMAITALAIWAFDTGIWANDWIKGQR